MACACGSKKDGSKKSYVVTSSAGTKTYSSEIEAKAAAARLGGTVKVA